MTAAGWSAERSIVCVCVCRIREQEQELIQLRLELQRKQQLHDAMAAQQRMQLPQKGLVARASHIDAGDEAVVASAAASPLMSSVTKVVQPTATVSSVPVSGPSKLFTDV